MGWGGGEGAHISVPRCKSQLLSVVIALSVIYDRYQNIFYTKQTCQANATHLLLLPLLLL